jgi:uncharacterized membrane protein YtjA (UPF0391 family)
MTLLKWALICLLISLVAGALGFTGVAAGAAQISKILFFIFLVIFLVEYSRAAKQIDSICFLGGSKWR